LTIKAVTFDFWSTLYKSRTVDYSKRLQILKEEVEEGSGQNVNRDQFEAAVKTARETWSRTWLEDYHTINAWEWLGIFLQELGISLDPAYVQKMQTRIENTVLDEMPTLVEEGPAVLADLSSRYKLAVISDTGLTPGRVLHQVMEHDDIAKHFTHFTFSDEVGRSKPHPDAFLTTLKALGVEPHEAVHIGDLLRTDVAGAQNVGMKGVQYIGLNHDKWMREVDAPATGVVTPDALISNHLELEPLIQSWNHTT
jgi:putative hydrolase of the HAD superfamily